MTLTIARNFSALEFAVWTWKSFSETRGLSAEVRVARAPEACLVVLPVARMKSAGASTTDTTRGMRDTCGRAKAGVTIICQDWKRIRPEDSLPLQALLR